MQGRQALLSEWIRNLPVWKEDIETMKTAIAIDLELLKAYMMEYIAESEEAGEVTNALTLSGLLIWLQQKEKCTNGKERPVDRVQSILRFATPRRSSTH